jgi:hypothetical protein
MPLILAIEPDRRQANQLNAVVKGRLHADLVLADSAERALKELGDRVPDLILTSALLSPTDEVVLGDRLRALNGVAAHVQTLTIPVLAAPRPRARARASGMLSALRRGKNQEDATPDGCDPTVFAAQCAEYLERAVAEQKLNAASVREERTSIDYSLAVTAAPAIDASKAAEVQAIHEFATIEEPMAPAVSSDPVGFTRSTNPFIPDPVPAAPEPVAQQAVAPETFAAETFAAETFAAQTFAAERPAAEPVVAEPFVEAQEPIAEQIFSSEPADSEPLRQPVDTPPDSFSPRRREPSAPVFIDATAAAASVSEAIAQIEAYVARESLATETIAKLEANEFAETAWETGSSGWEAGASGADEDTTEETSVPESFIELDLSTLLEDPQVETPKRGDDKDDGRGSLRSAQFETDDEPFVFDINEFNEFLVAASKPAVKAKNPFVTAPAAEPTIDAVVAPPKTAVEKIAAGTIATEEIAPQKIAPEKIAPEKIEKVETDTAVVESPAPEAARKSPPLVAPSRLGVSQLWPSMDGGIAEDASSLGMYKDGRGPAGKRANSRHKPIQDEWGFFDPEQCGFAALLAKLDEIIDTDDRST